MAIAFFFIDEKGEIVPATMITSMIADRILAKNPSAKIIVDIRYVRNVLNVVEKHNGSCSISKVGHAFISEQMAREDAEFAGESSGHFFFKSTGYAESSITVLAYLISILSENNKPLSELVREYNTSIESGEINFEYDSKKQNISDILHLFEERYKNGSISKLDGLAIDFSEYRFNIRASNTEPLMRLNVEAENKSTLDFRLKELTDVFGRIGTRRV